MKIRISLKNQIWILFSFSTFLILFLVLFSVNFLHNKNWKNEENKELKQDFIEFQNYQKNNNFQNKISKKIPEKIPEKILEEIKKNEKFIFLEKNFKHSKNIEWIFNNKEKINKKNLKKDFLNLEKRISKNNILEIKNLENNPKNNLINKNEDSDDKKILFQIFEDKNFWKIIIWKDITKYNQSEEELISILVWISFFLFFLIVILWYFFSRIIIIPVKNLQENLEKIDPEKIKSQNIILSDKLSKSDELFLLQKTFQNLLNKIKNYQTQQNEFISLASHEIRTPLTSIINSLEVWKICPEIISEKNNEALNEAQNLVKLVNQLLILSKLENNFSENKNFELEKILLSDFLENEIKKYKNIFWKTLSKNKIILKTKIKKWIILKTNLEIFKRIIENFLENSIKFTPKSWKIFIELSEEKILISNSSKIKIETEKITNAFVQWDSSKSSEWAGLWLYFAKKALKILWYKLKIFSDEKIFFVEIKI